MFEYLTQIDEKIYGRYLTVERNIKAASNSFYDSFLDLQENFLKIIIGKEKIEFGPHVSCGELLRRPDVQKLFTTYYGVDLNTYDKMGDYAKKANEHKHRKEKHIEVETVIKYMHIFYGVSSKCAGTAAVAPFDEGYFKKIFGSMSKVDERLSGVEEGQQEILDGQQEILNRLRTLENAKHENHTVPNNGTDGKTVLKNFVSRAEKEYNWFGTNEEFTKSKKVLMIVQSALILVGLISTILSSVSIDLYSTFTFFENIVLIQTIILLTHTMRAKKRYLHSDLARYNSYKFVLNADGIWRDSNKEKKRYRWLRRISYICVIANIIIIWTMGSGAVRIFATIFELAFLALTIATVFLSINLYCMYCTIVITGLNSSGTERVALVYDCNAKKLFDIEEYEKRFPSFI